jgi:chemotaxis protein MotB
MARRRGGGGDSGDAGGAWLTTYGDTVTLLLAFFVMLYAISQVDAVKFQLLVSGLEDPFDNKAAVEGLLETGNGIVGPTQRQKPQPTGVQGIDIGPANVEFGEPTAVTETVPTRTLSTESELIEVRDQLLEAFELIGISTRLGAEIDTRGLVISIATDDVLFASGSPALAPDAAELIGAISPVLRDFDNEIRIEGHTDTVPLDDNGYTNWNLSSDRALAVLGLLAADPEIDPHRLSATGYGEYRPIAPNSTEAGKQKNRRVELVIAAATPPDVQETNNE